MIYIGVDTPRGLSVWNDEGPVFHRQYHGDAAEARMRLLVDLHPYADQDFWAVVEMPHVGNTDHDFKAGLISNAVSAGYIAGVLSRHGTTELLIAGQWRKHFGIVGSRAKCKQMAMTISAKARMDLGVPIITGKLGGDSVDCCEADLMALAAMERARMTGKGTGVIYRHWREQGKFAVASA